MKTLDLLSTASSNMWKNKARTILTVIAVFIGAFTISMTNGIGSGVKDYLGKQIGNLGSEETIRIEIAPENKNESSDAEAPMKYDPNEKLASEANMMTGARQAVITQEKIDSIKEINHIEKVVPQRSLRVDFIQAESEKFKVTVIEQFGKAEQDMVSGRSVNNSSEKSEITLPKSFVKSLGFANENEAVGKKVRLGVTNPAGDQTEVIAEIVGIQQKTLLGSSTTNANNTLADEIDSVQTEGISDEDLKLSPTVVALTKRGLSPEVKQQIKDELQKKGFKASTLEDESKSALSTIDAIIAVFAIFGGIALLAASFGIVNTLLMSVQERTKEIGLMKALGASPRSIFSLFSLEAVLIGFWGSALGVLAAIGTGELVNKIASQGFLKDFPGLSLLSFPPQSMITTILGIMLIAFLAGTLPAIRASRKDPIEALRHD